MTTPKKITEAQAQQLANILGMFIIPSSDAQGCILKACEKLPSIGWDKTEERTRWYINGSAYFIPAIVDSTRPLTEQIWRPD